MLRALAGDAAKSIDRLWPWPYLDRRFFWRSGLLAEMLLPPTNEFSRTVMIDPWPDTGIDVNVAAEPAERLALARRFDLPEVRSLRGCGRLERGGEPTELVLRGWLEAAVVQSCVVSLEPVPAKVREPVERRYRRVGARAAGAERVQPTGVIDLDEGEDEVELLVGREIDLGEAFAQELGLSLDPYPRAVGAAAIEATALGPHVSLGQTEPSRPFAALRQLHEKHAR
ncbi:MAG: YceD family protein [Geminicoccaceae bacterium]